LECCLKRSEFVQELIGVQSLKETAVGTIKTKKSWNWGLDQQDKEPKHWQGFLYQFDLTLVETSRLGLLSKLVDSFPLITLHF